MTRSEGEQIARIIDDIFYHEKSISPHTVAMLFRYLGRLNHDDDSQENDIEESQ